MAEPRLVLDGSVTHLVCAGSDDRPRKGLARVLAQQALARQLDGQPLPDAVRAAVAIRAVHAAWLDDCAAARVLLPEA